MTMNHKWIDKGIKRFSPEKPPIAWQQAHTMALFATALAKQAEMTTIIRNRPVPRTANCHFSVVDRDRNNYYFY